MKEELEQLCKVSKQSGYLAALSDVMQVVKKAGETYYINPVIIEHIHEEIKELEKEVMVL